MSKARRVSIYVGPELAPWLDPAPEDRSATHVLNRMASRYAVIIRHSLPRLSLGEWALIFDALNGTLLPGDAATPWMAGMLHAEIEDAIALDALAEKWDVTDPAAFVARLSGLSVAEEMAVFEATERFWARAPGADEDTETLIREIVGDGQVAP
jgi:hypothetical protein